MKSIEVLVGQYELVLNEPNKNKIIVIPPITMGVYGTLIPIETYGSDIVESGIFFMHQNYSTRFVEVLGLTQTILNARANYLVRKNHDFYPDQSWNWYSGYEKITKYSHNKFGSRFDELRLNKAHLILQPFNLIW